MSENTDECAAYYQFSQMTAWKDSQYFLFFYEAKPVIKMETGNELQLCWECHSADQGPGAP